MSRPPQPAGSIKRSLLWMFSSQGLLSAMQLAVLMVLGRLLTPAEFGAVTIFLSIAHISGHLASVGFGPALVQNQAVTPRHVGTAITVAAMAGILCGVTVYLLRIPILNLFQLPGKTGLASLFILLCPVTSLHLVFRSLMQKHARFRSISIVEAVSFLLFYALPAILLARAGFGPTSVILAFVLNLAVNTTAFCFILRPPIRPTFHLNSVRDLSRTGLGFGLGEFVSMAAQNLDKLIVGVLLGPVAVGLYGRAYTLMLAGVHILTAPLDAVMFPTFAAAQQGSDRLRELLAKTQVLVMFLCLPASLLMITAPEGIIRVMLGPNWSEAASLLRVFGLLLLIRAQSRAVDSVLRARGLVYRRLVLMLIFCLLMIGFVALGSAHGLPGIAIGVTLAFLCHWLLVIHSVVRDIQLTWRTYLSWFGQPLLWSAAVILSLMLIRSLWPALLTSPILHLAVAGLWITSVFASTLAWRPALLFGCQAFRARALLADLLHEPLRKLGFIRSPKAPGS